MTVLVLAGLVAGIATVFTPCVLPVLPLVLAAGADGSRARPVGVVCGLAASFALFTLVASRLLDAAGLPQDALRNLAIVLLALAGVALLVPRVGEALARPLERLRLNRAPARPGFAGGLALGACLGLVWTPCAGPVLAAITVLAAERRVSGDALAVTIAYAAGAALPLLAIALASEALARRLGAIRRHAPAARRALGALLVAAAALFTTSLPDQLATATPGYASGLQRVERSGAVAASLRDLTARSAPGPGLGRSPVATAAAARSLHDYGPAPAFAGIEHWYNTPGGRPLDLGKLRGRVVLVDFWTYSCVNCLRTLPYTKAWDARYRAAGLTIVGVHTPEFAFEHVLSNVAGAIREHGIRYPVAVDNRYATWTAWQNQYWPAEYLIDRRGHVRAVHFGEGDYALSETHIRTLLGERSAASPVHPTAAVAHPDTQTPETYLGSARADAYHQRIAAGATHRYALPARLLVNAVGLGGSWRVERERIVAVSDATIELRYVAHDAYLVLAPPPAGRGTVSRTIDSRPFPALAITGDDLYTVAAQPGAARPRTLRLRLSPGTSAYAFTFG